MEQFAEKLDNLLEILDEKYNLNSGGCCFAAYVIAKNLELLNIRYKLIVFENEYYRVSLLKNNKLNTRRMLKERSYNANLRGSKNCSHYCIKVGDVYLNKSRYRKPFYSEISFSYINSSDIKFIYDGGYWNDDYNSKYNPVILKTINKFFKKYGKNII